VLFAGLVSAYDVVGRCYPKGADLFRAFLRLHEVENLKLGCRAAAFSVPAERWMPLWRDLGRRRSLDPDAFRSGRPPGPFSGGCLEGAPPWNGGDLSAAELSWDLWASREVVAAARNLSARDEDARQIALARVRDRDLQVLRRGASRFGLTPAAAAASTALLGEELGVANAEALAGWRPEAGPFDERLRRGLSLAGASPPDWRALELAFRRKRRRLCLRAFRGNPFCLAPPVAYLTLKEEEVRSVRAVAEAETGGPAESALDLLLAAGPMES
jgi:hypothetical protein